MPWKIFYRLCTVHQRLNLYCSYSSYLYLRCGILALIPSYIQSQWIVSPPAPLSLGQSLLFPLDEAALVGKGKTLSPLSTSHKSTCISPSSSNCGPPPARCWRTLWRQGETTARTYEMRWHMTSCSDLEAGGIKMSLGGMTRIAYDGIKMILLHLSLFIILVAQHPSGLVWHNWRSMLCYTVKAFDSLMIFTISMPSNLIHN